MTTAKIPRSTSADRLPESTYYRDTGCDVYPSCLRCPLPKCIYEETPEERAATQQRRDSAIYQRYEELLPTWNSRLGAGFVGVLCDEFGVSKRTVHRAVRRCRTKAT